MCFVCSALLASIISDYVNKMTGDSTGVTLVGFSNCHECHSRNKWIFLSPRSLKVSDCWGTQCDAGFQQRHGSSSPVARWAHRGQAAALGREVWGRGKCGGQCHVPEPRGCVILLLNRGPECKTSSSSPNLIEWCPTCTFTMLVRLVLPENLRRRRRCPVPEKGGDRGGLQVGGPGF